jgi:hypothetical protein
MLCHNGVRLADGFWVALVLGAVGTLLGGTGAGALGGDNRVDKVTGRVTLNWNRLSWLNINLISVFLATTKS